jgi:hypothetical protein
MNKVKMLLTLLTIAIIVLPIAIEVLLYKDNLLGLIVPPEIAGATTSGNTNNSILNPEFTLPQPVGEPQYNPESKTASFTFNFTNPLNTTITVDKLEAGIVSHDDGVFLGNVSIREPLTLAPGQTSNITILSAFSNEAIEYFKTQSKGQNSTNIDVTNLNAELAGVKVHVDRQNIGNIPIPSELLGDKNASK